MVKVYEVGEIYSDGKTPVPSYDEYCNLVFQANKPKNPLSDVMMCYDTEREKKVVERLQEQIKEANEVIKKYAEFNNWEGDDKDQHDMTHFVGEDIGCGWSLATDYLEKWGVK